MDVLTGTSEPFRVGSVRTYEYKRDGERRSASELSKKILFDDVIGEIGAKLRDHAADDVCWWIRKWVAASDISRALSESPSPHSTTLACMFPESGRSERERLRTVGGLAHVCPYLSGVYNVAVHCAHKSLPPRPKRLRDTRTLCSMASELEVHYIKMSEIQASGVVATEAPASQFASQYVDLATVVLEHPAVAPVGALMHANNMLSMSLQLGAAIAERIDPRSLIARATLTDDAFALAKVDPDASRTVRVLETAVRAGRADATVLAALSSPPHPEHSYLRMPVRSKGTITVTSESDVGLACTIQDPASTEDVWATAGATLKGCLGISLSKSVPILKQVSVSYDLGLREHVSPRRVLNVIQESFDPYLHAALTSNAAIECVYRRSSGVKRLPSCIEHLLSKHARGRVAKSATLDAMQTVHCVKRVDAQAMAEDFDVRQIHLPPTASVRLVLSGGAKMHASGTSALDTQRAMLIVCLALSHVAEDASSTPRRTEKARDIRAAPRNAADIVRLAEDRMTESPERERHTDGADVAQPGLDNLIAADPDLFKFKSAPGASSRNTYARSCGTRRQPVAVTDSELSAMGADAPDAVKVGPKQMNYMCPEVWCEGSRTAMTRSQAEASGWRCPNGDAAVDMMASAWWQGAATRHIGFLKSSVHPDGFPLPCCFKTLGHMQRQRLEVVNSERADTVSHTTPEAPDRYVMREGTVPLPVGRAGAVRLGDRAQKLGIVRVGVNQQRHTFLACAAATTGASLQATVTRLLAAMTPCNVASAAHGSIMTYLLAKNPFDLRSGDSKERFMQYAASDAGSKRLSRRGMRGAVSDASKLDMHDPDVAREAIVAHVYENAVAAVKRGDSVDTKLIQLLVLCALGERYPEVSVSGGETYMSCIRWDERTATGVVRGLLFRDGRYLEPLVGVTRDILDEVSASLARACGSKVRSVNYAVLECLARAEHIVTDQVCDEAHICIGVIVEGDLFVPFPEPHTIDGALPVRYRNNVTCAHPRWTLPAARGLFKALADATLSDVYQNAAFGRHCVRVGEFTVPLHGGTTCMVESHVRVRATLATMAKRSRSTPGTDALESRARSLREVTDHILTNNEHAYVALTSPLSPLTPNQKQALFESVLPSQNDGDFSYTDLYLPAVTEYPLTRDGEVLLTEADFADASAQLILGRLVSGAISAFDTERIEVPTDDPISSGLDETVAVPESIQSGRPGVVGKTSSMGSLHAISAVVGQAGGVYNEQEHGRIVAHRALLQWRMTGELDPRWPEAAKALMQSASVPGKRAVQWKRLTALGAKVDPADEDIVTAFLSVPISLEVHREGDGVNALRRRAAWRVIAWRNGDGRVSFATIDGSPLLIESDVAE